MDALSSAEPLRLTLDLQLTVIACSLYPLLGRCVGQSFESAKFATIFQELVRASATIDISDNRVASSRELRLPEFQKLRPMRLMSSVIAPDRNESPIVELAGGRLTIGSRSQLFMNGECTGYRAIAFSAHGSETRTTPLPDAHLGGPPVQASLVRYSWPGKGNLGRDLSSNPPGGFEGAGGTDSHRALQSGRWPHSA